MAQVLDEMIECNGPLTSFFREQRNRVVNSFVNEYNEQKRAKALREEGRAEGELNFAFKLVDNDSSLLEVAAKTSGMSLTDFKQLYNQHKEQLEKQ